MIIHDFRHPTQAIVAMIANVSELIDCLQQNLEEIKQAHLDRLKSHRCEGVFQGIEGKLMVDRAI